MSKRISLTWSRVSAGVRISGLDSGLGERTGFSYSATQPLSSAVLSPIAMKASGRIALRPRLGPGPAWYLARLGDFRLGGLGPRRLDERYLLAKPTAAQSPAIDPSAISPTPTKVIGGISTSSSAMSHSIAMLLGASSKPFEATKIAVWLSCSKLSVTCERPLISCFQISDPFGSVRFPLPATSTSASSAVSRATSMLSLSSTYGLPSSQASMSL